MIRKTKTLFFFLLAFVAANGQQPAFYDDIQNFKKLDSVQFPPRDAILFVGSSSFTKWTDVQNYFPEHTIINRGFGGSSLPDVIRYADDIIFPYLPKQIVIYCGENDIAGSDTVTAQTVFSRFKQLFKMIRSRLENVLVFYISMKPSPSRQKLMPKFEEANELIKNYLGKKKKAVFIDVYHKMLNADGTPMKDIFIEDSLHMNAKGYAIWQKIIGPYLLKNKI
ncbi:MAG: GDSL-type esterase/lipase family protein [Chitinophagaceae bacterium]